MHTEVWKFRTYASYASMCLYISRTSAAKKDSNFPYDAGGIRVFTGNQ